MIYPYPRLAPADLDVIDLIQGQRAQLKFQVNRNPNRWGGFLRRNTFARALRGGEQHRRLQRHPR